MLERYVLCGTVSIAAVNCDHMRAGRKVLLCVAVQSGHRNLSIERRRVMQCDSENIIVQREYL